MSDVLITTIPFAKFDQSPTKLLKEESIEYLINPIGKKPCEEELIDMLLNKKALIAGTEEITENVLEKSKDLKFISRVGVGLDSIDLIAARKKGVMVSYTPEIPSSSVAELTIGMILSQLRYVHSSDSNMHNKIWRKKTGRRLGECSIGLIGVGRIGEKVLEILHSFKPKEILVNDIDKSEKIIEKYQVKYVSKDDILKKCDVISLHVPLNKNTFHMIGKAELNTMKQDAIIVNTSRGKIINEHVLFEALQSKKIGGAAIDVYSEEPYYGDLTNLENCLLTPHIGPMSIDCRSKMEMEATLEVIRYFKGDELKGLVPDSEYEIRGVT